MVQELSHLAGPGAVHGQARLLDQLGGPGGPFSRDREAPVKEIYALATEQAQLPPLEFFREELASEDVDIVGGEGGLLFSVTAQETRVDVRFEAASPEQQ